jgi:two-component system chemotaxis response regulator CheB
MFELVVVVASLGGLPVISALVAGLPPSFPVPVLVVQHRPRGTDQARLPWLLGRRTTLPVRGASPGLSVFLPGVTVIPGGYAAVVNSAGHLHLAETCELGGDALLISAAETASHGALIAVVLSGMLRDGANGVRAVKRHGGRVLAQDPSTAEAPGMPSSALATGCVDFALPPNRLASGLVALAMAPGGAELLTVPLPPWAKMGA